MSINSKRKGSTYERLIAKKFEEAYSMAFCRTPQSGGFIWKGDITPQRDQDRINWRYSIECKNNKNLAVKPWLEQARTDAEFASKKAEKEIIPLLVFHIHNTSQDYVILPLDEFFKLTR